MGRERLGVLRGAAETGAGLANDRRAFAVERADDRLAGRQVRLHFRWNRHREHGIAPSSLLFHAERDERHLATPDGLRVAGGGAVELCEIKTTSKPWRGIPRGYLRQVWRQQYVLSAERTPVVWQQHDGFVPVAEPECRWVDRDENQIAQLVRLADLLLEAIRPQPGAPEPVGYRDSPGRAFYRPGPLA